MILSLGSFCAIYTLLYLPLHYSFVWFFIANLLSGKHVVESSKKFSLRIDFMIAIQSSSELSSSMPAL